MEILLFVGVPILRHFRVTNVIRETQNRHLAIQSKALQCNTLRNLLTLKVPIKTAADDNLEHFFIVFIYYFFFRENKT